MTRGAEQFVAVIGDVFQDIDVENGVERLVGGERCHSAGAHLGRRAARMLRKVLSQRGGERGIRFQADPAGFGAVAQQGCIGADAGADFEDGAADVAAQALNPIALPVLRVRKQAEFTADVTVVHHSASGRLRHGHGAGEGERVLFHEHEFLGERD